MKVIAFILALFWMISVIHGQTLTAVVQFSSESNGIVGYTPPDGVQAYILSASTTNDAKTVGVAWSGTNAIQFTLSQLWSTYGTNEAYGGPAILSVGFDVGGGKFAALTPTTFFDPSALGTNTVVIFTPSSSVAPASVLPATNQPTITMTWTNWATFTNRLQRTDTLAPVAWYDVTNFVAGCTVTITVSKPGNAGFYRAVIDPPVALGGQPVWYTNQ